MCEYCFELDAAFFGLAIVMDMLLTAFVMVITYRCTKKKSSAGLTHTAKGKNALKLIIKKHSITLLYIATSVT